MQDHYGHQISYLRVSITDRCNERCAYCMPQELQEWFPRHEILTYEEMLLQNKELLRALDELRTRQMELAQLNRELDETNRGVVALYAELDERAAQLKEARVTQVVKDVKLLSTGATTRRPRSAMKCEMGLQCAPERIRAAS